METSRTQPIKGQPGDGEKANSRPNYLIAIVIILVIAIIGAGGFWFYDSQKKAERESVETELKTIAQLKVGQISQWRTERAGDAQSAMDSPFVIQGVSELFRTPNDPGMKDEVIQELAGMGKSYPYQDVLLVNPAGQVLISINHTRSLSE